MELLSAAERLLEATGEQVTLCPYLDHRTGQPRGGERRAPVAELDSAR